MCCVEWSQGCYGRTHRRPNGQSHYYIPIANFVSRGDNKVGFSWNRAQIVSYHQAVVFYPPVPCAKLPSHYPMLCYLQETVIDQMIYVQDASVDLTQWVVTTIRLYLDGKIPWKSTSRFLLPTWFYIKIFIWIHNFLFTDLSNKSY